MRSVIGSKVALEIFVDDPLYITLSANEYEIIINHPYRIPHCYLIFFLIKMYNVSTHIHYNNSTYIYVLLF